MPEIESLKYTLKSKKEVLSEQGGKKRETLCL